HVAARHIPADFERQIEPLERLTIVERTQNRAVLVRPLVGVSTNCKINAPWIYRIRRNALHTTQVPIVRADPVEQWNPPAGCWIPAIRASNVGARINKIRLARAENNTGYEPAPAP